MIQAFLNMSPDGVHIRWTDDGQIFLNFSMFIIIKRNHTYTTTRLIWYQKFIKKT